MAKLSAERDYALLVPYVEPLTFCPVCKMERYPAIIVKKYKYCPMCGQRIKLICNKSEWQEIVKDAMKIPDVMETDIVTTEPDLSQGAAHPAKVISGVFLERLRAWNDKNAQIEGQMSLF